MRDRYLKFHSIRFSVALASFTCVLCEMSFCRISKQGSVYLSKIRSEFETLRDAKCEVKLMKWDFFVNIIVFCGLQPV